MSCTENGQGGAGGYVSPGEGRGLLVRVCASVCVCVRDIYRSRVKLDLPAVG